MLMLSRAFGSVGSLQEGWKLFIGIGEQSAVTAREDLFSLWSLGFIGFSHLHGFYKCVVDTLGVLNDFVRQVVVMRRDSGRTGPLMIFMGSTSGFLMHWTYLTNSLNKWWSVVGLLG